MFAVAIVVCRLMLGYLFGGTTDQAGYVELWAQVERQQNLYADSTILSWPPYWWLAIGLWTKLWSLLEGLAPGIIAPLGKSFSLKLFYYAFEIGLASVMAAYLRRVHVEGLDNPTKYRVDLSHVGMFLLLPATWVITALHGNFDVMPTFFVIFAFFLLEFESSETAVLFAALLIGLAIMARTFPAVYLFPAVAFIVKRFRWQTGLLAMVLCLAPSFLSLYPVYLMTPEAVVKALSYRGIPGGWWGLGGFARLFVSGGFSYQVFQLNYPLFYFLLVSLVAGLSWGVWSGRIRILQAGIVLSQGLFCFAPTISNQNFYFLIPWAFWCALVQKQKTARFFLWVLSLDLFLIYIVLPLDLTNPVWFQWSYAFPAAGRVEPMASPAWLVTAIGWFVSVFKRDGLDYNPFIQLVLRLPVWGVLLWWFSASLKKAFELSPVSLPVENDKQ